MPIEVLIQHTKHPGAPSRALLTQAIRRIANDYGWEEGQISIAIVDDRTIHQVNLQYLQHDYPTDVISFDLTEGDEYLEGEIIVSLDTAMRVASENEWSTAQELLLYVVHGMLHVIGLNDTTAKESKVMRQAERHYLQLLTGDTSPCESPPKKKRKRI